MNSHNTHSGDDRRQADRRSGQERRLVPDRRTDAHHVCVMCTQSAPVDRILRIALSSGDVVIHPGCALELTRNLLDILSHADIRLNPQLHDQIESLSMRELDVLTGMVQGLRDREIGERCGISETTVKRHASTIRKKLDVRNRAEAAARAISLGLVLPPDHQDS